MRLPYKFMLQDGHVYSAYFFFCLGFAFNAFQLRMWQEDELKQ